MEAVMEEDRKKICSNTDVIKKERLWQEVYAGTYTSEKSKGVYRFLFNRENAEMTEPELYYEAGNAKWVSLSGDMLAFPVEKEGRAGTCFVSLKDKAAKRVGEILEEKDTPCFILQDGEFTYTANYHDGTVMVYHIGKDGPVIAGRIENGREAGCHQVIVHGAYIMVPCLTQHVIRLFDRRNGFRTAGTIQFPDGSGPRHGVFDHSHSKLYVVSEWSNELFIFDVQDNTFLLRQQLSVLPAKTAGDENKQKASAAAVRLAEDERFLYISVRGLDLLTVVDVSGRKAAVLEHVSSGGEHPRDFVLTGEGGHLLVANRFSGGIVSMKRNRESGRITGIQSRITMPEGVSLVIRQ